MSAMLLASILFTVLGVLVGEEPGCLRNLGHRDIPGSKMSPSLTTLSLGLVPFALILKLS